MKTEGIAEAYLASGWCGRCGGKRNQDGNCPNCDRWYNHPLLTLGGGLAVSLTILMLVGIRAMRDADPGFARFASGSLYAASIPTYVPSMPSVSRYTQAPRLSHPATALGAVNIPPATPKVFPLEAQYAQLESLREVVHTNEHAFRTGSVSPYPSQYEGARKMPMMQANIATEISR